MRKLGFVFGGFFWVRFEVRSYLWIVSFFEVKDFGLKRRYFLIL